MELIRSDPVTFGIFCGEFFELSKKWICSKKQICSFLGEQGRQHRMIPRWNTQTIGLVFRGGSTTNPLGCLCPRGWEALPRSSLVRLGGDNQQISTYM
ncbi:hypothetical protein GOP47_0019958 [Adiantum capillus-veneris]|uniref:Uncharacterized protein n=1 Tax=Adiantum capillus-veneris TaxID=13818 RepID=A0A9D4UC25_ADICA|nr:hypothetical protein GOP47_0019958 [Adiantum capillus-veneris]